MTDTSEPATPFVRQRTLKHAIHCSGVGRTSGTKVAMTLQPGPPNSGVVFHRIDLGEKARIAASWKHAANRDGSTRLEGADGLAVASVEHLLSALSGCAVDNAVIELNGPEIPAMDGSAAAFVFLLECAGVVEQEAPRRAIVVHQRIHLLEPGGSASLSPAPHFSVHCETTEATPGKPQQAWYVAIERGAYKRDICRARHLAWDEPETPVDAEDAGEPAEAGIAGPEVLENRRFRHSNEPLRHRILDMIGDLYLAGGPIVGHANAIGGGDGQTLRLLNLLFEQTDTWSWSPIPAAGPIQTVRPATPLRPPAAAARA